MKTKVIRSGDKNFEEEKAKMFEPMNKEEQLRKIFRKVLTEVYFDSYDIELQPEEAEERYIEETTEKLLYEVRIRTKL